MKGWECKDDSLGYYSELMGMRQWPEAGSGQNMFLQHGHMEG